VGRNRRTRLRALTDELARRHPEIDAPASLIEAGAVLVDGLPVDNPRSRVRVDARIELRHEPRLRGEVKLRAALAELGVAAEGRVALDVGAAAGGFTRVLLEAGAARVYAMDAGFGQLLGSLRADPRVIVLERVNLGTLDTTLVPGRIGLVTMDLSYLSVAAAAPQLGRVRIEPEADLVALVKPMFELGLAAPPGDPATLETAVEHALAGLEASGWRGVGRMRSPVTGARGAVEHFVHARRAR
jgi:23S rRNA (cytidine1920-2'-O)/16S rRNA (cytidine1409-2'-O)-methyltransferase